MATQGMTIQGRKAIKEAIGETYGDHEFPPLTRVEDLTYQPHARYLLDRVFGDRRYTRGKSMLDVGCGTGAMAISYAREMPQLKVRGVDGSRTSISEGRKFINGRKGKEEYSYLKNVTLETGNLLDDKGRISNSIYQRFVESNRNRGYDLVHCWGVLHHLPVPEEGFKEIVRTVEPERYIRTGIYGKRGNVKRREQIDRIRQFARVLTSIEVDDSTTGDLKAVIEAANVQERYFGTNLYAEILNILTNPYDQIKSERKRTKKRMIDLVRSYMKTEAYDKSLCRPVLVADNPKAGEKKASDQEIMDEFLNPWESHITLEEVVTWHYDNDYEILELTDFENEVIFRNSEDHVESNRGVSDIATRTDNLIRENMRYFSTQTDSPHAQAAFSIALKQSGGKLAYVRGDGTLDTTVAEMFDTYVKPYWIATLAKKKKEVGQLPLPLVG